MARCSECGATFDLEEEDLEEGEFIDCPECGVELEVTAVDPLRLELVDEEFDKDEYENGDPEDADEDWS